MGYPNVTNWTKSNIWLIELQQSYLIEHQSRDCIQLSLGNWTQSNLQKNVDQSNAIERNLTFGCIRSRNSLISYMEGMFGMKIDGICIG